MYNTEENQMNAAEISKMSVTERLQTMEELWDSLIHEKKEISPPNWHGEVLSAREEKIKNGEANFTSLEKLRSKNK